MLRELIITLFLLIFVFNVSASSVELEEGWNTFSVQSNMAASEIISDSSCSFHSVQGTDNYFFEQSHEGEYTATDSLNPWNAYYGWVSEDCVLETDEGDWSHELELEAGEWNLIRTPSNIDLLEDDCSISKGSLDYKYWAEFGGEIVGFNQESELLIQNRGIFVWPTESCSVNYENIIDESTDSVEESYLEFEDASVVSDMVSPDESNLNIEFNFDRDSAVQNDVEADVGLHINEESSAIESFKVSDSSDTQELTLDWEDLWNKFDSEQEDVSAQLVLEEKTEGTHKWNRDSIDAGNFELEKCSNFNSNIDADEWEYNYNPEETSSCLGEVSLDSTSNTGEYDFNIFSGQNGVCGEVELDSTYWYNNGAEVVSINLDNIEDSSDFRETELRIRHFNGGTDDAEWITLVEEDLSNIEETEYLAEFKETFEEDTHSYNKVEITLTNDNCSGDELEVSGTINYDEYSEDGPGTCKPGQTWCESQYGDGACIDDENYSSGLCY